MNRILKKYLLQRYFYFLITNIIKDHIKGKTIIIGDRLYTDIKCGHNANIDTCFVLSGDNGVKDINALKIYPKYIIRSLQ